MPVPTYPASRVLEPPREAANFRADYWDCFRIATPEAVRPGIWAALALGRADSANRAFGNLIWHRLMGFDLASRGAPQTLTGWRVTTDTADAFVMDVEGSRTSGRMVFAVVAPGELRWTTMLRHHTRGGRAVWSALGHAHRLLAPWCLNRAHHALTA